MNSKWDFLEVGDLIEYKFRTSLKKRGIYMGRKHGHHSIFKLQGMLETVSDEFIEIDNTQVSVRSYIRKSFG